MRWNPPRAAGSKPAGLRDGAGRAGRKALALAACISLIPACSVKKFAVRQVGDALASGPSTFETDSDVDLG